MIEKKVLFVNILILIFLSNFTIILAAQDIPTGNEEISNRRKIEEKIKDDYFEIKSELVSTSDATSEFVVKVELDNGIRIRYNYEREEYESKEEAEFNIWLKSLIEYYDLDGDGGFDNGEDIIINEIEINSLDKIKHEEEIIDDFGNMMHTIKLAANDVLTSRFYFVETFNEVDNNIITPTEVKFDIEIEEYDYLNDSSKIALYVKIECDGKFKYTSKTYDEEMGFTENEAGLDIKSDKDAFFTWNKEYKVDDDKKDVIINYLTDDEEEDEICFFLNYEQGDKIIHDPKFGIADSIEEFIPFYNSSYFWMSLLIVLAIGGLIVFIILKNLDII